MTVTKGDWIVVTTRGSVGIRAAPRHRASRSAISVGELRKTAARNASLGLLFIGLALVGIVPLSARLTRNLSKLSEGVDRIAHGDYSARVPVKTNDEVGRLATAFNQMAADVEQHQRAAVGQERIRRELELGRQIQHEMLPHAPLRLGLTRDQGRVRAGARSRRRLLQLLRARATIASRCSSATCRARASARRC